MIIVHVHRSGDAEYKNLGPTQYFLF